jgi:hypothetical protein
MSSEERKKQQLRVREQPVSPLSFEDWLTTLYDISKHTDEEIMTWYEAFKYQGFDRTEVMNDFFRRVTDTSVATQLVVLCALRGPRRAAESPLLNGQTPRSIGIPASDMKGKKGVSCQRITAATADLAAYYLKKMNAPKRLNLACPGWLQFPSAGSIKLPPELREQHMEFAKQFSKAIGGEFNESIYQQMVTNAYYDQRLNLF